MHDLRTIKIPKISDGEKFEYLCRDLWVSESENECVALNGRRGQRQLGVDIFGRKSATGNWFAIQCKSRSTGKKITKKDILTEIESAKKFNPVIQEFILCTNLDRDVSAQKIEREINDELFKAGSFIFKLVFWDDIEEKLKKEENFHVYYRFYQKYFVDSTKLGHSIGKLLNLQLGVDEKLDSYFEIMIGKIPNHKKVGHSNANYYRGTFFIVDFHGNKMETFTVPCFESDLLNVFTNHFDRFRIVKWLESIESIDDLICSEQSDFIWYVTQEERDQHNLDQQDI